MDPTVFIVEDDRGVRDSIVQMLRHEEIPTRAFATPGELFDADKLSHPGCLVLDLVLPEMNGIELYERLQRLGCNFPFIIISAHGRVGNATRAMHLGAVDFIEKPIDRERFLKRIWQAIELDVRRQRRDEERAEIKERLASLTRREREVLDLVVAGELTKNIARRLGVTVKTIEAHRSNITKKMKVESVVQLVRTLVEYRLTSKPNSIPKWHVRGPLDSDSPASPLNSNEN